MAHSLAGAAVSFSPPAVRRRPSQSVNDLYIYIYIYIYAQYETLLLFSVQKYVKSLCRLAPEFCFLVVASWLLPRVGTLVCVRYLIICMKKGRNMNTSCCEHFWCCKHVSNAVFSRSSVSFHSQRMSFVSSPFRPTLHRFKICCLAKKETIDKVCHIVKKHLSLPESIDITGESKFSELGADSLDTVEIVMGLEEEFNITVDETSAQDIATVQDAANLIEKLVLEKSA